MKKQIFRVLLFCCVCVAWGVMNASAAYEVDSGICGEYGSNLRWTLDSEGTLFVTGYGNMYNFGSNDDGGRGWVSRRSAIRTAIFDAGVTSVGNNAFRSCLNLREVILPEGLTSIGMYAFRDCISLQRVYLPGSLSVIYAGAFAHMNWSSPYPNNNAVKLYYNGSSSAFQRVTVREYNFSGDANMPVFRCSVTPTPAPLSGSCGVNMVWWVNPGQNTLYIRAQNASSMNGYSVLSGTYAPWNGWVDYIRTVSIGDHVQNIGNGAFAFLENLNSVRMGQNVTVIGKYAFMYCGGLSYFSVPSGVRTLDDMAFGFCSNLTSVSLPASLTAINSGAFWRCDRLSGVSYAGNRRQWRFVALGEDNDALRQANITFADSSLFPGLSNLTLEDDTVSVTVLDRTDGCRLYVAAYGGDGKFLRVTARDAEDGENRVTLPLSGAATVTAFLFDGDFQVLCDKAETATVSE